MVPIDGLTTGRGRVPGQELAARDQGGAGDLGGRGRGVVGRRLALWWGPEPSVGLVVYAVLGAAMIQARFTVSAGPAAPACRVAAAVIRAGAGGE